MTKFELFRANCELLRKQAKNKSYIELKAEVDRIARIFAPSEASRVAELTTMLLLAQQVTDSIIVTQSLKDYVIVDLSNKYYRQDKKKYYKAAVLGVSKRGELLTKETDLIYIDKNGEIHELLNEKGKVANNHLKYAKTMNNCLFVSNGVYPAFRAGKGGYDELVRFHHIIYVLTNGWKGLRAVCPFEEETYEIHHIDRFRTSRDNRPQNLQLLTLQQHKAVHSKR